MTDKERIAEHIYETHVRRRGWEHWNQMSEVEKSTSIKRFADPIFNILGYIHQPEPPQDNKDKMLEVDRILWEAGVDEETRIKVVRIIVNAIHSL